MNCPNCGAANPDGAWNCVSCRINLYWATQHFADLAKLRDEQGRVEPVSSPTFLLRAHRHAMEDRATRGHNVDNKVRVAARRAMQKRADQSTNTTGIVAEGASSES